MSLGILYIFMAMTFSPFRSSLDTIFPIKPSILPSRKRNNLRFLLRLAVRELRTCIREILRACSNAHPLGYRVVIGICYPYIAISIYCNTSGIIADSKRGKQRPRRVELKKGCICSVGDPDMTGLVYCYALKLCRI